MIFDLNYLTLAVFAPLLVLVGILGFVIPARKSPTSGAAPYNISHIIFGIIGAGIVLSGSKVAIRKFNLGFGLLDLYQAVVSFSNIFPKQYFKWTRADDILHVGVGAALMPIGIFGS